MPQNAGIAYNDSLPGTAADGAAKTQATDRYGAMQTRNETSLWAEQGSYFRALASATPGTGVAQAITTGFSATAVPLVMVNGSATKRIIPHYIRLVNTAAGASTTSSLAAISIDSANRYASGGTDISGLIYNSNSALGPATSVSVLRVGAVTASAAGAGTRYISNFALKVAAAPTWTLNDEVVILFGQETGATGSLSTTTATQIVKDVGPVVLGGQDDSLILHLWNVANAATPPSWAFEIAWWER